MLGKHKCSSKRSTKKQWKVPVLWRKVPWVKNEAKLFSDSNAYPMDSMKQKKNELASQSYWAPQILKNEEKKMHKKYDH